MKLKPGFVLIALLTSLRVTSQSFELENVAIPVSPTAQSFMNFSGFSSPAATGKYPIDVPLFSFSEGPIDMNISLSYQSTGIKVGDISGVVGLGWSMGIGGAITRNMMGRPDEGANGYLAVGDNIDHFTGSDQALSTYLTAASENRQDTQPDLFNFYYPGGGGTFVYNYDGSILSVPYQDILIQDIRSGGTINHIVGFIITDQNGVDYYYTIPERTTRGASHCGYSSTDASFNDFNTAWFLEKIEGPSCELITFNYDSSSYNYEWTPNEIHDLSQIQRSSCLTKVNSDNKFVTGISSKMYDIEFVYSTNQRNDLPGAPRLDRLVVKNKSNQKIKEYSFSYSETQSSQGDGYYNQYYSNTGTSHRYRLFLNEISQWDIEGAESIRYRKFDYNSTLLPSRLSTGIDWWGYYNGKNNNSGYIGEIDVWLKQPAIGTDRKVTIGNADRSIDASGYYSKAGILKKMWLPTGGYTEYYYEPNTYNKAHRTFAVRKKYEYEEYKCGNEDCEDREENIILFPGDPNNAVVGYFEINKTQEVEFTSYITGDPSCNNHKIRVYSDQSNSLRFTKYGGFEDITEDFKFSLSPGVYRVEISVCDSEISGSSGALGAASLKAKHIWSLGSINTNEITGGLRIAKVKNCDSSAECLQKEFFYENGDESFGELIYDPNYLQYIVNWQCYDSQGNHYGPEFPDNIIRSLSWSTLFNYMNCSPTNESSYWIQDVKVVSNPQVYSWGNSHINYSKIIVSEGLQDTQQSQQSPPTREHSQYKNGYTENEYTSLMDFMELMFSSEIEYSSFNDLFYSSDDSYKVLGSYQESIGSLMERMTIAEDAYFFPGALLPNYFWAIGKPKSTLSYDSADNLLYESSTRYKVRFGGFHPFGNNSDGGGIASARGMNVIYHSGLVDDGLPLGYWIIRYDIPAVRMDPAKVEETTHAGGKSIKTTTEYTYDEINYLVKEVSKSHENGDTLKVKNQYVDDYAGSIDPAVAQLQDNHQSNTLISSSSYLNDKVVSASVNSFRREGGYPVRDKMYSLIPYENQTTYDEVTNINGLISSFLPNYNFFEQGEVLGYLSCGVPNEYATKDGIINSIVWNSDNTMVLAKVANANRTQVSFNNFDQTVRNGWLTEGIKVSGGYSGDYANSSDATTDVVAAGDLTVSFWLKGNGQIKIGNSSWISASDSWSYHELELNHSGGGISIQVSGDPKYDDFLVIPKHAVATAYTYNSRYQLVTEGIGLLTNHYKYDGFGRLVQVIDAKGDILKAYQYQYKTQNP